MDHWFAIDVDLLLGLHTAASWIFRNNKKKKIAYIEDKHLRRISDNGQEGKPKIKGES